MNISYFADFGSPHRPYTGGYYFAFWLKDFLPFGGAFFIQELAQRLGEWQGFTWAFKYQEKINQRINW